MTVMQTVDYLRLAIERARQARASGNHPFGAILVGPDGAVLMEAEARAVHEGFWA